MPKDLQIIKELEKQLNIKLEKREYQSNACVYNEIEDTCFYSIKDQRVVSLNLEDTPLNNDHMLNLVSYLDGLEELNIKHCPANKIACIADFKKLYCIKSDLDYLDILDYYDFIQFNKSTELI